MANALSPLQPIDASRSRRGGRRLRARPSVLVVAAIVVVLGLWMPSLVASTQLAPQQPVAVAAKPWLGWQLIGELVGATGSDAATPGAALEAARAELEADDVTARSARLVWLPGGVDVEVRGPGGRRATVDPPGPLAWVVEGRIDGSDASGVVGVLDYADATLVWSVDAPAREGERPAPATTTEDP